MEERKTLFPKVYNTLLESIAMKEDINLTVKYFLNCTKERQISFLDKCRVLNKDDLATFLSLFYCENIIQVPINYKIIDLLVDKGLNIYPFKKLNFKEISERMVCKKNNKKLKLDLLTLKEDVNDFEFKHHEKHDLFRTKDKKFLNSLITSNKILTPTNNLIKKNIKNEKQKEYLIIIKNKKKENKRLCQFIDW